MTKVESEDKSQSWFYSDTVKDHFMHPRNLAEDESLIKKMNPNGDGTVGNPVCGDVMKMWVRVDEKTDKIKKCLWKTFGCASAIASTSMLSVMVTKNDGMNIDDALKIKPMEIIKQLGELPKNKIHCSVL